MTIIDQSLVDSQGNVQHTVAGRTFSLPLLHEVLTAEEPVVRFGSAIEAVNTLHEITRSTQSDATLSDLGKAQRLEPRRDEVLKWTAGHIAAIDDYEASLDAREARLTAVPELHPQNAAEAVIDRELRDWWRSQSVSERAELMRRMQSEPGHSRLQIALLRSPYALLDTETTVARDAWQRAKRLENPAEATAIDQGRVVTEWARRAFGHLSGVAMSVTTYPRDRVLSLLLADKSTARAASSFGFQKDFIEQAERAMKGKARQAV